MALTRRENFVPKPSASTQALCRNYLEFSYFDLSKHFMYALRQMPDSSVPNTSSMKLKEVRTSDYALAAKPRVKKGS